MIEDNRSGRATAPSNLTHNVDAETFGKAIRDADGPSETFTEVAERLLAKYDVTEKPVPVGTIYVRPSKNSHGPCTLVYIRMDNSWVRIGVSDDGGSGWVKWDVPDPTGTEVYRP